MRVLKFTMLFSLVVFISCAKNEKTIYKYYPNGGVEYKITYHNGSTNDYTEIKYKENGELIHKQDFIDNKRDGAMLFYRNNNLLMIKNYKADSLHGIIKYFSQNEPNKLDVEYLIFNGKYIAGRKYSYNKDSSLFQMVSHYFYNKDTMYEEGRLYWDVTNEIIPDKSNYYQVFAEDTIRFGERYEMKVVFVSDYECELKLELGEMDDNLVFRKSPNLYKGHNFINIELIPKRVGNNLIVGKLITSRDTLIDGEKKEYVKEYIFYHGFYVSKTAMNN